MTTEIKRVCIRKIPAIRIGRQGDGHVQRDFLTGEVNSTGVQEETTRIDPEANAHQVVNPCLQCSIDIKTQSGDTNAKINWQLTIDQDPTEFKVECQQALGTKDQFDIILAGRQACL